MCEVWANQLRQMPEILAIRGEQALDIDRMKHNHPSPNEQGKMVTIRHPSVPSSLEAFPDPKQLAVVVPDGQKPAQVNDIALDAWLSAPTTLAAWVHVAGQADIN